MENLVGRRFGRLVVVEFSHKVKKNGLWKCLCDCAKTKIVQGGNLRGGRSLSCGCLQKERASKARGHHRKSGTPIYRTWASMRMRCVNPNNSDFHHYGGRGITVCDRWLNSFDAFLEDMGPTWADGLSIERKDVNGNYEPSNCKWATIVEQRRNMRKSLIIDSPWGRLHWRDVAERAGITAQALLYRMKNWPEKDWYIPQMRGLGADY